jgi:hypothetical protein
LGSLVLRVLRTPSSNLAVFSQMFMLMRML